MLVDFCDFLSARRITKAEAKPKSTLTELPGVNSFVVILHFFI